MQHLLDFIVEHTLEDQLYFVAHCPEEKLEVLWKRGEASEQWQVRPQRGEGPWEIVWRSELIGRLEARGADMGAVKQELHAMLAAQIAFADMVLRDANQQLGREVVERFVVGHQEFIRDLQAAIEQIAPRRPSMTVVSGGGEQTQTREGHLSVVR